MTLAWRARDQTIPVNERYFQLAIALEVAFLAANTVASLGTVGLPRTRRWQFVNLVRAGLLMSVLLHVLRIMIYPTPSNWVDALFPTIFLPYFFLSRRVGTVFRTKTWNEPEMTSLHLI